MTDTQLARFGFGFSKRSVHVARTLMLAELTDLLAAVPDAKEQQDYIKAIIDENCLGKKSFNNRKITADQLIQLYTLDPQVTIFRNLLYFWQRDEKGRPLLALICAATRDSTLKLSAKLILEAPQGELVTLDQVKDYIENLFPDRYSKVTLTSMAQNIRSTWTKTGHLSGRITKKRTQPESTPGTVAYALLLGYLMARRGTELFETEYVKILDCTRDRAAELAEQAGVRGWIVFKRIGNVMEAIFPNLLTEQEVTWLREQAEAYSGKL